MKNLSTHMKAYLITTYLAGSSMLILGLLNLRVTEPLIFVVLCILGSVLHILKVDGATNRSHYTLSFLIFGFALLHLGISLALLVILVSSLAQWIWNRPPWFIQLFNISCYTIAAQVAMLVYTFINSDQNTTSWPAILGIGLGMASFTLLNHLMIGLVVWLAHGENFKQSGVFGVVSLLIDSTMLAVGASLALVWNYNPYAILLFLTPGYPLYMALRIPALERQTEIDQKTGLYNHQYFVNQFSNELQRANRYDRPLALIIADLDLLRNINNTYGHLAGDEVLKGVATILRRTVRDYDTVARFGGEEFAILMPEIEIEKAVQRAESTRKAIEAAQFVVPTSVDPIKVTMSFGVSKRENFDQSRDEILHHADIALYRSKLSGRNKSLAYVNGSFLGLDPSGIVLGQVTEREPESLGSLENQKCVREYPAAGYNYLKNDTDSEEHPDEKLIEMFVQRDMPDHSKNCASRPPAHSYIRLLAVSALFALGLSFLYHGYACRNS
jgi:diguanylate cyclase (GGDEF)-like protein